MFGVGIPEILVIFVVGVLVFGPDKLPEFGRQAGRFVRQFRQFTRAARDDIRRELGPEYADFELTDLNPRRVIQKHIIDPAWAEDELDDPVDMRPSRRVAKAAAPMPVLAAGETPPYDSEAT